jgi:hypothetical protein
VGLERDVRLKSRVEKLRYLGRGDALFLMVVTMEHLHHFGELVNPFQRMFVEDAKTASMYSNLGFGLDRVSGMNRCDAPPSSPFSRPQRLVKCSHSELRAHRQFSWRSEELVASGTKRDYQDLSSASSSLCSKGEYTPLRLTSSLSLQQEKQQQHSKAQIM